MNRPYWEVTNQRGEVIAMCYHPVRAIEIIKNSDQPLGLIVNNELQFDAVNLSFALLRSETEPLLWEVLRQYVNMEGGWHKR